MNELLKLKGSVQIKLNGKVVVEQDNLIVNVGKTYVMSSIVQNATVPYVAVAVGTSSTPPSANDTLLGAEVGRVAFTFTQNINVVTITASFGPGVGTGALQEAGIFNSTTANAAGMLSHLTFGIVNKGSTDTLQVTWTLTM